MNKNFGEKFIKRKFNTFAGLNAEAPLWILIPKTFVSLLVSDVLLLIVFFLGAGELSLFFLGFVIFIDVLQILIIIGLRFQNRTDIRLTRRFNGDRLDDIGAWRLVACAFGALFGWACSQLAAPFPAYESFFLSLAVILTTILPVVTMLPHLRYVETQTAHVQIPLLCFITVLPILVGLSSLLKLWVLIFP